MCKKGKKKEAKKVHNKDNLNVPVLLRGEKKNYTRKKVYLILVFTKKHTYLNYFFLRQEHCQRLLCAACSY